MRACPPRKGATERLAGSFQVQRRAVWFTGPRRVEVREEMLAEPAAGHVRVRTLVSAISGGTELLVYRGQAPADMAADTSIAALGGTLGFPLQYGYSAVGRVEALGADVPSEWLGRPVFAFQPHQSAFLARMADLLVLPADLEPDDAAFLPNLETAVNLVQDGQPLIGEQVVVFGQGIVGLLTSALLARMPLAALVTLDHHPRRRQLSLDLGAHASLDPADADTAAQLAALLRGDRDYSGADLAYEISGVPEALDRAVAAVGFNGRVVVASWYGSKRADLDLGGRFHRDRIRIVSSQVSTIAPELSGRWTETRRLQLALDQARILRPSRLVSQRFPIERAAEAYELLDTHPQEALQVILTY
jgi:2-desacetyl-2-hydroxyethyl bacteriochlorophyllide A dehydrogenase